MTNEAISVKLSKQFKMIRFKYLKLDSCSKNIYEKALILEIARIKRIFYSSIIRILLKSSENDEMVFDVSTQNRFLIYNVSMTLHETLSLQISDKEKLILYCSHFK